MTLARRLLAVAGGAGSFTPPLLSFPISDAANGEGGWSEVGAPRGQYDPGADLTIFGYVCGNERPNNIEVMAWDHVTQTYSDPFVLHAALSDGVSTVPDTHNAPAFWVRPDGKYVAAYCGHRAAQMRIRRSTNAGDITAWEAEQNTTLPNAEYTYPNLVYLSDNDTSYLFWRDGSSLVVATSVDGWVTLDDGPTTIYTAPGHLYFAIATNGVDRIDMVVTDTAPELTGGNGLWHFYALSDGTFHETDGTLISSGLPFDTTDLTEVQATDGDIFPYSLSYTADARPVVGCATQQSTPIMNFEYRWTGTWDRHDIAETGPFSMGGTGGANVLVFDDATRALVIRRDSLGDTGQLDEYQTADDGVTWTFLRHRTTTADQPQGMVSVRDADPSLVAMWMEGPFTSGDDYSVGTVGMAL